MCIIMMMMVVLGCVGNEINLYKYWEQQQQKYYPQIHYARKTNYRRKIVKPTVTQYDMFNQKMNMLEQSSKQEIEQLKQQKKELKERIVKARDEYNNWVLKQQQRMLNEYEKGKNEILRQEELKKQLKLQEMKKEFAIWKQQFEMKKQQFKQRFYDEIGRIKEERKQRENLLSTIYQKNAELNDLLKQNTQRY